MLAGDRRRARNPTHSSKHASGEMNEVNELCFAEFIMTEETNLITKCYEKCHKKTT